MQASEAQPHVFISYSRQDKPFAQRLIDELHKRGVKVWIDSEIKPGTASWE